MAVSDLQPSLTTRPTPLEVNPRGQVWSRSRFRSSHSRRVGRFRSRLYNGLFMSELRGFRVKPFKLFRVSRKMVDRYVGVLMLSSSECCKTWYDGLSEFQKDRDVLFKRVRRYAAHLGRSFEYCGSREFDPDGSGKVHSHILFRGLHLPQELVSTWWAKIHRSSYVWVNYAYGRHSSVAGYISKYLTKDIVGRYFASRNWIYSGFVKDYNEIKSSCFVGDGGYVGKFIKNETWFSLGLLVDRVSRHLTNLVLLHSGIG